MDGTVVAVCGEAALAALGFFWKAGWAFIFGYAVSAMIQAFVPKGRLTPHMGTANIRSLALATFFGAASSSCSFAALATARALFVKGAHFIAAVAFMFASTNLVIELGVLILIFLGWQFLAAEIVGGLLLIAISTVFMRLSLPGGWVRRARENLAERMEGEGDFDWRERIVSREGWLLVGHTFVMDWQMVWEEILIGFTIAGFVAVAIPDQWWEVIFLVGRTDLPPWLVTVENALVAPFVAACTFIGSMGNIPLATVLHANGVLFTGIMGFIYSDLMIPPLVAVNAQYYGWRLALYVAGVMYVSIAVSALALNEAFRRLDLLPESTKALADVSRFAMDYTFWLNLGFAFVAVALVTLHFYHKRQGGGAMQMGGGGVCFKRLAAYACMLLLLGGLGVEVFGGGG